jgi:hypothetical protein
MTIPRSTVALPVFTAMLLGGLTAWACWIAVPLESLVASADVIVVGKIGKIERAPGKADYEYDRATIEVRAVIKGRHLVEKLSGTTERVPLWFPAETNRLRVSTDLRYEKGQRGVWLLTLHRGRLMAKRPDSLQPLKKRGDIRKLAAQSPPESEPPADQGPRPRIEKRRPPPIAVEQMP